MAEFSIIYLSDLHIGDDNLPLNLEKLIVNVKEETKDLKNVVLCIAGDIFDKGAYRKNPFDINAKQFEEDKKRQIKIDKEYKAWKVIHDGYNDGKNNLYDSLGCLIDWSRVIIKNDKTEDINEYTSPLRNRMIYTFL